MQFTNSITELIKRRTSTRTYSTTPIEAEKKELLQQFIASNQTGPFHTRTRFQLITANQEDVHTLKGLGTYGFIKNPQGFIIGAMEEASDNLENFGYVMEKIILFATELGLGTCWLGGSFRQSRFAEAIRINEKESVPAVTSIGYAGEKRRLLDSLIQTVSGSRSRLPWENLFFSGDFETPLSQGTAGKYAIPLEMVRLAPSASNKQPWRIIKEQGKHTYHFYLQRTKGADRSKKTIMRLADLQRADIGIAMCHFELSANELNLQGTWERLDPENIRLPEQTEYTVSWIGEH